MGIHHHLTETNYEKINTQYENNKKQKRKYRNIILEIAIFFFQTSMIIFMRWVKKNTPCLFKIHEFIRFLVMF
jgi:hypothetical protein